jgi:hypothetical protein
MQRWLHVHMTSEKHVPTHGLHSGVAQSLRPEAIDAGLNDHLPLNHFESGSSLSSVSEALDFWCLLRYYRGLTL